MANERASQQQPWDLYSDYLQLDKILHAQTLASAAAGRGAHDEMLFIVFHQIYELWFKQILFELDDIQARFSRSVVDDRDMQPILTRLERIAAIWRLLVQQIDVLETMSPQDFIDFRDFLKTASGFQSWQFRLIETRLGLRREDRLSVFHGQFDENFREEHKQPIAAAEKSSSLFEELDGWLARTPFVSGSGYAFGDSYRAAVHKMLDEKEALARQNLVGEALAVETQAIARGRRKFDGIFDAGVHQAAQKDKQWRMSLKALQAALFITVYRQEPVMQIPWRLLSLVMDVDELLAQWRYRHALMVQRMVGMSMGSGGSSGYGYLIQTLEKHRIFADLFALSGYLIPARALPKLPESVSAAMGYRYTSGP